MTEPEMAAAYPGRGFAGTPRVPTDTERLDWLGRQEMPRRRNVDIHLAGVESLVLLEFEHDGDWYRADGCTLRDAIDAGMRITGDL